MATPLTATAFFCEDIREEKAGAITIIGMTPDNLEIPEPAGLIPRLCIFIRINFDPDEHLRRAAIRLTFPDGHVDEPVTIEEETFELARKQSKEQGNPLAGVISRVIAQNLPITLGRLFVELVFPDRKYLAGTANFVLAGQVVKS